MKLNKSVLAIHDISCVGKCSLTVVLPILSASGITTNVLPTAVLSTHTGGFKDFIFRDLTDDIVATKNHWLSLNLNFDYIYTGFLGSIYQVQIIIDLIDSFNIDKTLILIDPVMGDNGLLYSIFDTNFVSEMKKLCIKADIIIPNLTEASLLLDIDYNNIIFDEEYIKKLLIDLSNLGPNKVVLTGLELNENTIAVATYDSINKNFNFIYSKRINKQFHGTGDIFASTLLSGLANNKSLKESVEIAMNFTLKSIELTDYDSDLRFGVNFEKAIPLLIKSLSL